MPKKKTDKDIPIGKKIKKIRAGKKIGLDNLANETGFSVDYLKKIETGKMIPTVSSLLQISRALEIDSGYLLREQETNVSSRERAIAKRTDNYAYETLTPGAEKKHLKAFRVAIDPMQNHKGVDYFHEGEEFVYVLSGKIEIMVGEHLNTLKERESLLFNSGVRHQLKNVSKKKAELLVVLYAP
jgi:transcriptional regulator with XRE-family HTH domain